MARLSKSDTLFRNIHIDRNGNRRPGSVHRALEALGGLRISRRMADVTGEQLELEPVIAVPAPPAQRRAALAEIAEFI